MQSNPTATGPALDGARPITRLVVPTVAGTLHDRTTMLSVGLAETWSLGIDFVHVTPSVSSDDAELTELAERVRTIHPALDVRATHLYGDDPATAIADHGGPTSLVVMSTDHIDAWRITDSVAENLLDRVGGPVLMIGPNVTLNGLRERALDGEVVVGVDGSAAAETGVAPALSLAKSIAHRLWLVRVVDEPEPGDPAHPEIARQLQAMAEACSDEIATRWEVIMDNNPIRALEAFAARRHASFLVVSRRRRSSPNRRSMASVAAGLAATADRPVLVLTAPETPMVGAG